MAYRHQEVLGARGTHPVPQGLVASRSTASPSGIRTVNLVRHLVWPWDPSSVGGTAAAWRHGAVAPGMQGLGFLPLLVVI